ncbi:MAG: acetoacetate--CoA ligase [Alphaproteobacteria bacterium]|nr:acetoacetate--CoA ligase [Alphaproteobacteria bacterium]TAD91034.1 MAG: acetoacetate--CoA ligase [Alphaproteobacteria bacterium]
MTAADVMLWSPNPATVAETAMHRFMQDVGQPDWTSLHTWSVNNPADFWSRVWDWCGVVGDKGSEPYLVDADQMPGAQFFPTARLNFAENLLRRRDDGDAIVFWGEDKVKRRLSAAELYALVSRLQQYLKAQGVGVGDRVAGYLPNLPEAVAAMLAVTSLGAVWSSASPDFGVQGVVDRFGQIEPKVLFCVDGYFYNGKAFDCLAKVADVLERVPSIQSVMVFPYAGSTVALPPKAITMADGLAQIAATEVTFERLPFQHPLYILYSSGTTGVPKCIVHSAGGTLLQHVKELRLHADVRDGDRVFYFTTLGWMMWNWVVSCLACNAVLLQFDGSPFAPSGSILFDYAEAERMTLFGTSAKYLDAVAKVGLEPRTSHDLSSMRLMTSTGSPLAPETFEFVYRSIKPDVQLASISGGTDIVSCFVLGNPLLPVWKGEIQCKGLGMKVEVWNDEGKPVVQEKGELVCTAPFPAMPVMFWNDPDGAKYRAAYFERFPGVWCHGDYVEETAHSGLVIYGRSDATLNPGGVRIGTAEIYRQVEQLPEILEALVIGQDWDNDVRVVLFVRLRDGVSLDEALMKRIRVQIRDGASPRHVPAKILAVADIPRTKSGKITELAVRDIVHGRAVKNVEALANPDSLALYKNLPDLQN